MTPTVDKRVRPFGEIRKKVTVQGVVFDRYYVFHKVIINEPEAHRRRVANWRANKKKQLVWVGMKPEPNKEAPKFHGPYQGFDYTPFIPKQRNGRWSKGAWLPIIPEQSLGMCSNGYHVTTMKFTNQWNGHDAGAQIYLVEAVGPLTEPGKRIPVGMNWQYPGGDPKGIKYVFQSIRFIRRLDAPKKRTKSVKQLVAAKRTRKKAA